MTRLVSIDSPTHAAALKKRDDFLASHPELRPLQQKIDKRLGNAQNDHNRIVIIHSLMMDAFLEMDRRLQALVRSSRSRSADS
ncbi:MAG: hypothetical protein AB1646_16765 [Thermodesulfobacteriota bacterium]